MRIVLAGLLAALLASCATTRPIEPQLAPASVDFAGAERYEVTLSNFEFSPETLRLHAGRSYALVLNDVASGGHDFTAPEFFAAAQIMPGDAALVANGQVDLQGGQSKTVHLVPASGTYDLVCTHTAHALLGMKGKIIVE